MKKSIRDKYFEENSNRLGWGVTSGIPEYKIRELLDLVEGPRVLDIGCGPGHFVDKLSEYGFEAVGIDSNKKFIEFAKENYGGEFRVAQAGKLPFKDKEFNTVYVRSVLEHLEDDLGAVREALRVGRKVAIIVPRETPKELETRGLVYFHNLDRTHLRNYTRESLGKLLEAAEAEIINITEIERLPAKSVVFEMSRGWSLFKRVGIKLWFMLFAEKNYYLELLAIIK